MSTPRSPQRQREHIEHWSIGPAVMGTIVGWAEDLDVSGGVSPFKRPELGKWLTRRADEFDVLYVWRLDRLTRRSRHFAELVDWCNEREKVVVSTSESLDLSTPMGKMFARIIAAFAEGELDTIQARSLDASRRLREEGAWFGGVEPFGYRFAGRGTDRNRSDFSRTLGREGPGRTQVVRASKADVAPNRRSSST
ncbi:recombinase family protein [Actinomadura violacea]|uniref:Recombinase family protein n=1 Tax=Actinomadura violacea TaxID=2819934 RepID=A0ABS3S497_9ACTN|nr:recombinase family protein [Actinomadura violacea]MBO2463814.1 recombinase family protein [Actinomadura violacea]